MFSIRKFKALMTAVFMTLSFLSLMPGTALAKTSIPLDISNHVVSVATVYTTTPKTQANVLSDVLKAEKSTLVQAPGFLNSAILEGQDGTKVVALTQWQDLSSFQADAAEHAGTAASVKPRSFVFEVKKTETRNTTPIIPEHGAVMFSEFKMKDPDKQSELAEIVQQMMPGAMQMNPGLQWAAMAPSTDKSTIALIAQWNSRKDFESLGTNPGFDKETAYWQTYADNEHDIFNVVEIVH